MHRAEPKRVPPESPVRSGRIDIAMSLPHAARDLVGRGLTDHPTSNEITTFATAIGNVGLGRSDHAKIIFYSRGRRDAQNRVRYPFSVEMNINHEYWHLRDSDPSAAGTGVAGDGAARIDIKFSFGNCLDDGNEVKPARPYEYVPEIAFGNLGWADVLASSRFPALAGWQKDPAAIFALLNEVTDKIFATFHHGGQASRPADGARYGEGGKGFGWGTVHHAVGTLRMPCRRRLDAPFDEHSVVDEDLRVRGTLGLHICDMSVMPFSSAANPVRTLAALALRLSRYLA